MHKNLEHLLVKQFPQFFKNPQYNNPRNSFTFSCEDGWFNIIYQICKNVESHIQYITNQNVQNMKMKAEIESGKTVADYWKKRYDNNELVEVEVPSFMAEQVKEKFGQLRFYYRGGDEHVISIVQMAYQMSSCTCEICGNFGKLRTLNWIRTLCDNHYHEFSKKESLAIKKELKVNDVVMALVDGGMVHFQVVSTEGEVLGLLLKNDVRVDGDLEPPVKIKATHKITFITSPLYSYYEATEIKN